MLNPAKISTPLNRTLTLREKFTGSMVAFLALVLVGLVSMNTLGPNGFPFMVASMGASSVLIFAVPYSPLSQPWPLIGGHLVSSCAGVTCALLIPDTVVAAAAAGSLAIGAMHLARCLHPPGGAVALLAVLGGQPIQALGYSFVLFPVLLNAVLLLGVALLLNNMLPGRRYPATPRDYREEDGTEFNPQAANVLCAHIMSRDAPGFTLDTPLAQAWRELQDRQLEAAPVLDSQGRVIGLISQAQLAGLLMGETFRGNGEVARLQGLGETTLMTDVTRAPVITLRDDSPAENAVDLLVASKAHALPVVNTRGVVQGMLSRSDVLVWLRHSSTGTKPR